MFHHAEGKIPFSFIRLIPNIHIYYSDFNEMLCVLLRDIFSNDIISTKKDYFFGIVIKFSQHIIDIGKASRA